MIVKSPGGVDFRIKPEMAYVPLFTSSGFRDDVLVREIYRKDHNLLWYKTSSSFYPLEVADFYEWVEVDPDTQELRIKYGNNVHTITKEVVSLATGIFSSYTQEQEPLGARAFAHWFRKIVPNGEYNSGYVKYGNMGKNQILVHMWINDNVIPGFKTMTRRQAEYLYTIQKRVELKADGEPMRTTEFLYCICEALRLSILHCLEISTKKYRYAFLPVLVTRLIRTLEPDMPLRGEKIYIKERKLSQELKKTLTWRHDTLYSAFEFERLHGFPLGEVDPLEKLRGMPFATDQDKLAYIDTAFRANRQYQAGLQETANLRMARIERNQSYIKTNVDKILRRIQFLCRGRRQRFSPPPSEVDEAETEEKTEELPDEVEDVDEASATASESDAEEESE